MKSDWTATTWGALIDLKYGKQLNGPKLEDGPTAVFGTNGPTGSYTSGSHGDREGIIVGRKGAYRGVVWSPGPYWVIDTAFYVESKEGITFNREWAFRALSNHDISAIDSGSAIPSTSREDVYSLAVSVPPLAEQRRIAWVLGSLDDRIELNRQMAQTLEEIAAAIFKARFVDFVGVEEFEDSELGMIPEGWGVGTIADVTQIINEKQRPETSKSHEPYIGLDVMPQGSTVLSSWDSRNKVKGDTRAFLVGDILFGKLRPYFKKVGVAPVNGSSSTEILVLRARNGCQSIAIGHLSSDRFIEFCMANARGTRMPRAEWKDIQSFPIALPPVEVARSQGAPIEEMYRSIRGLIVENRTLTALRDELLPKLISGKIRVPEGVGPGTDADEVLGVIAEQAFEGEIEPGEGALVQAD